MERDFPGNVKLRHTAAIVTGSLQYSFQAFPGATGDRIWVSISCFVCESLWNSRKRCRDCLRVTEVPSLKLFDSQSTDHLKRLRRAAGFGLKAGIKRRVFESRLQSKAVLSIFINQDDDTPVGREPSSVTSESAEQVLNKVLLALKRMNSKCGIFSDNLWNQYPQRDLSRGFLNEYFQMHGTCQRTTQPLRKR